MEADRLLLRLQDWWQTYYNHPDSALPWIVPACLWFSAWLYCKTHGKDYARWYPLHTLHHVAAMTLGGLSLYFQDESIFSERISILWSMPYFGIDIVDCIWERHVTYAIHALFCLVLGILNYTTPLYRYTLRMNARATFIESSTPMFYLVKQYRRPWMFGVFAALFTACRILYIPYLIYVVVHDGHVPILSPSVLGVTAFYGLNWFWYVKILTILWRGNADDEDDKKKNE